MSLLQAVLMSVYRRQPNTRQKIAEILGNPTSEHWVSGQEEWTKAYLDTMAYRSLVYVLLFGQFV